MTLLQVEMNGQNWQIIRDKIIEIKINWESKLWVKIDSNKSLNYKMKAFLSVTA